MSELKYIISLSKKFTNQIGFIPKPRIETDFEKGRFLIERENDEPCGFLYCGNGKKNLVILQAAIQYDAQRRTHGLNLVKRLILYAEAKGFETISCKCADDLEANEFWKSCGFVWSGISEHESKRGRRKITWVFYLPNPKQKGLF